MRSIANLIRWILDAADGEPIEAVVIGEPQNYAARERDKSNGIKYGALMSWDDAKRILDYPFDDGFGGAECHPVFVWTATKVLVVREYDGSTTMGVIPRNPTACEVDYL